MGVSLFIACARVCSLLSRAQFEQWHRTSAVPPSIATSSVQHVACSMCGEIFERSRDLLHDGVRHAHVCVRWCLCACVSVCRRPVSCSLVRKLLLLPYHCIPAYFSRQLMFTNEVISAGGAITATALETRSVLVSSTCMCVCVCVRACVRVCVCVPCGSAG